jgi:hypothetical protein
MARHINPSRRATTAEPIEQARLVAREVVPAMAIASKPSSRPHASRALRLSFPPPHPFLDG